MCKTDPPCAFVCLNRYIKFFKSLQMKLNNKIILMGSERNLIKDKINNYI